MKRIDNERIKLIKVALLVLASISIFIFGIRLLDKSAFKKKNHYFVKYSSAEGINLSTPIVFKGVPVGTVSNISLDPESQNVIVKLSISQELKIPKGSVALIQKSLLSPSTISIFSSESIGTTEFLEPGEILSGSIEPGFGEMVNKNVEPFVIEGESLIRTAKGTFKHVNDLLNENLKKNVHRTFYQLSHLMEKMNNLTTVVLEKESDVSKILTNTQKLTKSLNNLTLKLDNLLSQKGTIHELLYDKKLYENTTEAAEQLKLLLEDFRLHPKRYIEFSLFRKKGKPYKAPKKNSPKKKVKNGSAEK